MHPSYFAMYLCLSIAYLFSRVFDSTDPLSLKSKIIFTSLIVSFTIFIAFLASKMGIIVLAFIWLWAILFIVLKKKYYLTGIISLLLLTITSFLLYNNSEIIASRIDYALKTLTTKNLNKTSAESSTVRVLIWKESVALIKEDPFIGVGTGDIKDILLERYKAEGMTGAFDHKLNAHNQFLQTGIALGIPGLFLIISILIYPLFIRKHYIPLFIFFSFNIFLNFSVESMLEVQAGVIFYSYFNSLFLILNREHHL
jgi:O-antigen ligase